MSDEQQRALAVRSVAAVFMPIACVAVGLRCYVRGFIVKAFGWDDGAMVFAAMFYVMFSACMIGGTCYGIGFKFASLDADSRATAMTYWWLCEVAYCFASIGCKVSVCVFLLRITVKRSHIWILYATMTLTVLSGLVFFFLMLLQCKPLSYFWNRTNTDPGTGGSCVSINIIIVMTYIYSTFAVLCDFTVGILPIFIAYRLYMKKEAKIALVGILSMACVASLAVVIRFPFVKTFGEPDFLYSTYQIAIWSSIEVGLGITAGSLATLRPLLRLWLGSQSDSRDPPGFPRSSSGYWDKWSNSRGLKLGSMDPKQKKGVLRTDKLGVVVTEIESIPDAGNGWAGPSSSNNKKLRSTQPALPAYARMEIGINQTFQVTRTSGMYDEEGFHHLDREYV